MTIYWITKVKATYVQATAYVGLSISQIHTWMRQCVNDHDLVKTSSYWKKKNFCTPSASIPTLCLILRCSCSFSLIRPRQGSFTRLTWTVLIKVFSLSIILHLQMLKIANDTISQQPNPGADATIHLAPSRAYTRPANVLSTLGTHIDCLWRARLLRYGALLFTSVSYLFFLLDIPCGHHFHDHLSCYMRLVYHSTPLIIVFQY